MFTTIEDFNQRFDEGLRARELAETRIRVAGFIAGILRAKRDNLSNSRNDFFQYLSSNNSHAYKAGFFDGYKLVREYRPLS